MKKISVCIVTYNQENYIERCIISALEQNGDFELEILIGDDCSTDNTRKILKKFLALHPDKIKLILHPHNIGATKNYKSVHLAATGDYISHLDGDDWLSKNKLEKQYAFLETNGNFIAAVHKLRVFDRNSQKTNNSWPQNFTLKEYDLEDVAMHHPDFGHSSLMYKSGMISSFLEKIQTDFIDFQIYLHLASQGKIGAIDAELGNYTSGIGISSARSLHALAIQAIEYAATIGLKKETAEHASARQYLLFSKIALAKGDFKLFNELIHQSKIKKTINNQQKILHFIRNRKTLLKLISRIYNNKIT